MNMIKDLYFEKAFALHQNNPVVDTHLDLAAEVYLRHLMGEKEVIKNRYLDHFREAGINLVVSSVFVETMDAPYRAAQLTMEQIGALYEEVEKLKDVCIVKNAEEIMEAVSKNQIGIIIYMEGLDLLTTSTDLLKPLYLMGVRGASLTWSRRNYLGEGCCKASQLEQIPGHLSKLGIETVHKIEELGMFLDVSHLNDDGFEDVKREAKNAFIASHSNARAVQMNYRNMTDEQIKELARRGGVMGMNVYKEIVGAVPGEEGVSKICDHIQYIIGLVGEDHVGYGLDLCDDYYEASFKQTFTDDKGDCLKDHSELVYVTAELLRRGVSEEAVKKVIGQNFVRYFTSILK